MAITFLDPGGDAGFNVAVTTSNGLYQLVSSSGATVATDFVHGTHQRSIQFPVSAAKLVRTPIGTTATAGGRFSVYVYLNALPGATVSFLSLLNSGTGTYAAHLRLTSTGVLQLFEATVQIGSNGPTLATGTWYRLSLAWTISSTTVNRFEAFVDGVSAISVTNATITVAATDQFEFGPLSATTLNIRYSDIYIDSSTALTDTGNIWVTAKRPFSNGSVVDFATNGTGSGYGSGTAPYINQRPAGSPSTGFLTSTNTTIKTHEMTIEGQSVGDIDISAGTVVGFSGWVIANVDSTLNSPVHHIIVAGTATAITLTTGGATLYSKISGSSTYPAGNTDIGIDAAYTTTPHQTTLNDCGIIVAYTPPAPPPPSFKAGWATGATRTTGGIF